MSKIKNLIAGGLAVLGSVVPGQAMNSTKVQSQQEKTSTEIATVFDENKINDDTFEIGMDTIDHEQFIHKNISEIFDEYGEEKGLLLVNQHLLIELNKIRVQNGSKELVLDDQIIQLAQQQANHLDSLNKVCHENFGERLEKNNIEFSSYGENLGLGHTNIDAIVKQWMTSPGHKSNILKKSFKKMGLGIKLNPKGNIRVLNRIG